MKAHKKITSNLISTALLIGLFLFASTESMAQIRRPAKTQRQIQKRLEKQGARKLAPSADSTSSVTNASETAVKEDPAQPQKHSLDGIRERGVRTFFTREETQMIIPGFGSPAALMILLRQLDLTPAQKESFKTLRLNIGDKLNRLHNQRRQAEAQLEEAIYGEDFNPQRVEELAAQAADKSAEVIKTQAYIESQFRQILTPDQFFVFRFLVGEMVLPQRRLNLQQLRQQQLRRIGPGNQPNRPNQQPPEYDQ